MGDDDGRAAGAQGVERARHLAFWIRRSMRRSVSSSTRTGASFQHGAGDGDALFRPPDSDVPISPTSVVVVVVENRARNRRHKRGAPPA